MRSSARCGGGGPRRCGVPGGPTAGDEHTGEEGRDVSVAHHARHMLRHQHLGAVGRKERRNEQRTSVTVLV